MLARFVADCVGGGVQRLAAVLWPWCELVAQQISGARGVETTQLDVMTDAGDERERRWLSGLGYAHTRTWLQMSRPVDADEELLKGIRGGGGIFGVIVELTVKVYPLKEVSEVKWRVPRTYKKGFPHDCVYPNRRRSAFILPTL